MKTWSSGRITHRLLGVFIKKLCILINIDSMLCGPGGYRVLAHIEHHVKMCADLPLRDSPCWTHQVIGEDGLRNNLAGSPYLHVSKCSGTSDGGHLKCLQEKNKNKKDTTEVLSAREMGPHRVEVSWCMTGCRGGWKPPRHSGAR